MSSGRGSYTVSAMGDRATTESDLRQWLWNGYPSPCGMGCWFPSQSGRSMLPETGGETCQQVEAILKAGIFRGDPTVPVLLYVIWCNILPWWMGSRMSMGLFPKWLVNLTSTLPCLKIAQMDQDQKQAVAGVLLWTIKQATESQLFT